jgi:hypothetical protein
LQITLLLLLLFFVHINKFDLERILYLDILVLVLDVLDVLDALRNLAFESGRCELRRIRRA